ncbi:MAG: hypothetical protein JXO22_09215, partial [Phycisphaerae bacterium]|nr:hypothetical protein [Phycisphaerae bacterium]
MPDQAGVSQESVDVNPRTIIRTIQSLGPRTAFKRIVNAVKARSGYIEWLDRATPFGVEQLRGHLRDNLSPQDLLRAHHADRPPFFFNLTHVKEASEALGPLVSARRRQELLARTGRLKAGVVRFFSTRDYELGRPINWHLDPQDGVHWPRNRHWRRYTQFDPSLSDMKFVWEASRFAFCFDLVRAYGLTADTSWLTLGLDLIDEWIESNPPGSGVQWACGQETTFRLMAWMFLLRAATDAGVIDAERYARIAASVYRQAQRIEHYIAFSRSIRNNHSLSEAIGLFTVGALFPWFDRSKVWRNKGKR